jgi:hypothetical protein
LVDKESEGFQPGSLQIQKARALLNYQARARVVKFFKAA